MAIRISTLWFIVAAGFVSLAASLFGGLLMYFEGLKTLEKQVEEGSRSDMQAVGWRSAQVIIDTRSTALKYAKMLSSFHVINNNESLAEWLRYRALSDVTHSTIIEAGQVFGIKPNSTDEKFQEMIWWEPLANGTKEYIWCRYTPGIDSPETDCPDPCNICNPIEPKTGKIIPYKNVYDFSDPEAFEDLLEPGLAERIGREPHAYWAVPGIWFSSDNNPYIYISISVIIAYNDNPYFQGYHLMSTCDFIVRETWVDILMSYSTESKLMIVNLDAGVNSTVLAGNFQESFMIPNCSTPERETDDEVFHPCLTYMKDMPRYVQDVHRRANITKAGDFKRISTHNGAYWINRFVIFEQEKGKDSLATLNLVWFRAVGTVEDQMTQALIMFVTFVSVVFVFDVMIGILEITLLARPLRQLSQAMIPLDVMDLDKAEALASFGIESSLGISEVDRLRVGFLHAIKNLKEYKTFIPQSLFEKEDSSELPRSYYCRAPPLSSDSTAAVVFTDIQSSTTIWEMCPEAMKKDLKLHNSIVRECIEENTGYEVKTIGDAFMVTFDTVIDACSFSLAVQSRLYSSEAWDSRLLQIPDCSYTSGKWRGLRVRIGIHVGPVELEENPMTGISDYFGPTVNTAARLEGAGIGGAVAISSTVYENLKSSGNQTITASCITFPITENGEVYLKGISEPQKVYLMVPVEVEGRCSDIKQRANEKHKTVLARPTAGFSSPNTSISVHSDYSNSTGPRREASNSVAHLHLTSCQSCTIAHVGMSTSYASKSLNSLAALNELLSSIFETSSRAESTVVSVSATSVLVSWNTHKKCSQHLQQGVRFSSILHNQLSRGVYGWEDNGNVCVGISTGDAKFGNCGSSRQRYVMVIGQCVEIANTLTSLARKLGTFVLSASSPGHAEVSQDPSLRGKCRPVGIVHHSPISSSTVYQLRESSLRDYGKVTFLSSTEKEKQWGWSDSYHKTFEDRQMEQIELLGNDDPVLLKVVLSMKSQPEIPMPTPGMTQVLQMRRQSMRSSLPSSPAGLSTANSLAMSIINADSGPITLPEAVRSQSEL